MAVNLDSTVGGDAANSFASHGEALTYFSARLFSDAWAALTEDQQKSALIMATQTLSASTCFTGSPATTTQALPWPRTGMYDRNGNAIPDDVIPQDLKNAQFEQALAIAKGDRMTESDVEVLGLTKLKAGPVELGFSGDASAKIIPAYVTSLLPASWLCPVDDPNVKTIIFEAL